MQPIFAKKPSLQLRLFLAIVLAIATYFIDLKLNYFSYLRNYFHTCVSPFYFLINTPKQVFNRISERLKSHDQLELENKALRRDLFLKKADLLMLEQYKYENTHLRKLLNLSKHDDDQKIITKVILTNINFQNNDDIIIDKGSSNGVYEGEAVISDQGVVGQVVSVGKTTSRVLLICSSSHALPIQILRNDAHVVVAGDGCDKNLQLTYLADNIDIRVGDVLVTSGLGGHFPEGYPVAIVSAIKPNVKDQYSVIEARPTATLKNLKYLMLCNNHKDKLTLSPSEIHDIAKKRLKMFTPEILKSDINKI